MMVFSIGIAMVLSFGITTYVVRKLQTDRLTNKTNWLYVAVFYGLMLLGMLAREAYNALLNDKPFNKIGFGIAALVSPIVFGGIYGSLGNLEINVPSVVLAFQNGFFWNSIFEKIQPAQ